VLKRHHVGPTWTQRNDPKPIILNDVYVIREKIRLTKHEFKPKIFKDLKKFFYVLHRESPPKLARVLGDHVFGDVMLGLKIPHPIGMHFTFTPVKCLISMNSEMIRNNSDKVIILGCMTTIFDSPEILESGNKAANRKQIFLRLTLYQFFFQYRWRFGL
jgi:hypothetical protein